MFQQITLVGSFGLTNQHRGNFLQVRTGTNRKSYLFFIVCNSILMSFDEYDKCTWHNLQKLHILFSRIPSGNIYTYCFAWHCKRCSVNVSFLPYSLSDGFFIILTIKSESPSLDCEGPPPLICPVTTSQSLPCFTSPFFPLFTVPGHTSCTPTEQACSCLSALIALLSASGFALRLSYG